MSRYETTADPAFRSEVRASGLGEVWTHTHDKLKFNQFGWRCTTNEHSFSDKTFVGNWNEQRWDTARMLRRHPLPNSECQERWNTTYRIGYNKNDILTADKQRLELMKSHKTEKKAYPDHQPEHDATSYKHFYNSFQTTQREAYPDSKPAGREPTVEQEPTGPILDRGDDFLSNNDNCPPVYPILQFRNRDNTNL